MAATDLADLHNFEYHLETAAVTFLNSQTGLTVFRTVTDDTVITPRLEVVAHVTEALDPPILRGGGASPSTEDYTEHKAIVLVRVVTDNPRGQSDDHAGYVANCRVALMLSASNWDSTTLPYYDLKYLRNTGASREVDGEWNITGLEYELTFEIRRDAWPS